MHLITKSRLRGVAPPRFEPRDDLVTWTGRQLPGAAQAGPPGRRDQPRGAAGHRGGVPPDRLAFAAADGDRRRAARTADGILVELGNRSRRLQEDASIGVVFPALFSIWVILISRYADQLRHRPRRRARIFADPDALPADRHAFGDDRRSLRFGGSILVVAMLVVPPSTAYLLTEKLSR